MSSLNPIEFDMYYEIQKCLHNNTLYYYDNKEQEVLYEGLLLNFFGDEDTRRIVQKLYHKSRDSCKTMDELRILYLKKFIPIILAQIYLDIGFDPSSNNRDDLLNNNETI